MHGTGAERTAGVSLSLTRASRHGERTIHEKKEILRRAELPERRCSAGAPRTRVAQREGTFWAVYLEELRFNGRGVNCQPACLPVTSVKMLCSSQQCIFSLSKNASFNREKESYGNENAFQLFLTKNVVLHRNKIAFFTPKFAFLSKNAFSKY